MAAASAIAWTSTILRGWHTLLCMYATREHRQHFCHRVPSVACSGFLTWHVAQALLPVSFAGKASALDTGKSACATPAFPACRPGKTNS